MTHRIRLRDTRNRVGTAIVSRRRGTFRRFGLVRAIVAARSVLAAEKHRSTYVLGLRNARIWKRLVAAWYHICGHRRRHTSTTCPVMTCALASTSPGMPSPVCCWGGAFGVDFEIRPIGGLHDGRMRTSCWGSRARATRLQRPFVRERSTRCIEPKRLARRTTHKATGHEEGSPLSSSAPPCRAVPPLVRFVLSTKYLVRRPENEAQNLGLRRRPGARSLVFRAECDVLRTASSGLGQVLRAQHGARTAALRTRVRADTPSPC